MEARELLANLSHPDEAIRHKATLALGGCGREHRAWAPELIDAVRHGSPEVRFWAATALPRVAPDPADAVPALIALLSDPDMWANRQVAASGLAKIGRPAAQDAVPALARALATDDNHFVRESVVRSLRDLAVWNADAITALIEALDDPEDGVKREAAGQLSGLGERAHDAVPALRRLAEREEEAEAVRSQATSALESILSGAPTLRYDEPYYSISEAASTARFADPSIPDAIRERLDREDFEGAFRLLEAGIDDDQDSGFWVEMFRAARELELPSQHRYYERYLEASGEGGFWRELEGVVHSTCPVSKGMRRIVRSCARLYPSPGWKRFHKLAVDDDLPRLEQWLEAALTEEPPPADVPGLWFGLVDVDRGGKPSLDLYVSGGHPDDEEPEDRVIGGSWDPRTAYARSRVLDEIYELAHAEEGDPLEEADYRLSLAYGGLAVRWLAMTRPPELLLGGAPHRVLAVGFDDGDSIGVGTVRREGLVFPDA